MLYICISWQWPKMQQTALNAELSTHLQWQALCHDIVVNLDGDSPVAKTCKNGTKKRFQRMRCTAVIRKNMALMRHACSACMCLQERRWDRVADATASLAWQLWNVGRNDASTSSTLPDDWRQKLTVKPRSNVPRCNSFRNSWWQVCKSCLFNQLMLRTAMEMDCDSSQNIG